MSAENWLQRASGLVVPAMGFADHLTGQMQPCPSGDCCEDLTCSWCKTQVNPPNTKPPREYLIELSEANKPDDNSCSNCEVFHGPIIVSDWDRGPSEPINPFFCLFAGPIEDPGCVDPDRASQVRMMIEGGFGAATLNVWYYIADLADLQNQNDFGLTIAGPHETTHYFWSPFGATIDDCWDIDTTVNFVGTVGGTPCDDWPPSVQVTAFS